MSREAVVEFLGKVEEDSALQESLQKAAVGGQDEL